MKKALLIVAALALSASASAQQFKWVDKDGKVQYGDAPPPGVNATRIKGPAASTPTPAPSAPGAGSKDVGKDGKPLSPEAAYRKRQMEKEEADKKESQERAQAEVRQKNCDQAQAALRQLESGQRIGQLNAQGERVYMDDDQRTKSTQSAQKAVSDWCK